jgi:hypothetical protein
MTYRAYIDNIKSKTGKTPEDFRRLAKKKGFVEYGELLKWLKYTLFSLAGFFVVFAVWAAFGFSYPSDPLDIAFNDISKVLSFVIAITFFLGARNGRTDGV